MRTVTGSGTSGSEPDIVPGPFAPGAREVLADPASTLSQVMEAVAEYEKLAADFRTITVGVSSNITIELLGLFLRRHALLQGARVRIVQGNHDDPIGDVSRFMAEGVEYMVLVPFFDNLLPSFESQIGHLSAEAIAAKEAELRARYRVALGMASSIPHVFIGEFHRYASAVECGTDRVDDVIAAFNAALRDEASGFFNVRSFDTAAIVAEVGRSRAFDSRFYFSAKAPYSALLYNAMARRLTALTRGFGSYFYKALVLDCDNTLWGGIVGEDLLGGIKLDPYEYPGSVFWRVQNELVMLEQNGILLCLCTKNNERDIEDVLDSHQSMVIQQRHLVVKKVNWTDKVSNLREIARELNIGLDSLVFVDDSSFECEAVRSQLPMVRTFQVPAKLSNYPAVLEEIKSLFLAGGISNDSRSKTEQYRQRASAESSRTAYHSNDEYLASLGLRVTLSRDAAANVKRLSELSMKSNQFNLTTRRYTEHDIATLLQAPNATVYSFSVSDKFGDAGLTGILIARWEGPATEVDLFLMSCRVIGRGIEFAVWDSVLDDARLRGCESLISEYIPTAKNGQVADFYDRLGMELVREDPDGRRCYRADLTCFAPPPTPWIGVIDAG